MLDPEALSAHRANLVWGEQPKVTSAQVGAVSLSEDKTRLTFTPGSEGTGTLWVMFEEPVEPGAKSVERCGGHLVGELGTQTHEVGPVVLVHGASLAHPPRRASAGSAAAGWRGRSPR